MKTPFSRLKKGGELMEKHYSLKETAELLGIKLRTAREWVRTGRLKAKKYGDSTRWYVPESEIARIIGYDNDSR